MFCPQDRTKSSSSLTAVLTVSITHVLPEDAAQSACKQVTDARTSGFEAVQKMSSRWWNAYYPASFMSFSDTIMESFYWIQVCVPSHGSFFFLNELTRWFFGVLFPMSPGMYLVCSSYTRLVLCHPVCSVHDLEGILNQL